MDRLEQAKLALDLAKGGGTFRIDDFHEAQASALIGILEGLRKLAHDLHRIAPPDLVPIDAVRSGTAGVGQGEPVGVGSLSQPLRYGETLDE